MVNAAALFRMRSMYSWWRGRKAVKSHQSQKRSERKTISKDVAEENRMKMFVAVGVKDAGLFVAAGMKDARLFVAADVKDAGLFVAAGVKDAGLFVSAGVKDAGLFVAAGVKDAGFMTPF